MITYRGKRVTIIFKDDHCVVYAPNEAPNERKLTTKTLWEKYTTLERERTAIIEGELLELKPVGRGAKFDPTQVYITCLINDDVHVQAWAGKSDRFPKTHVLKRPEYEALRARATKITNINLY